MHSPRFGRRGLLRLSTLLAVLAGLLSMAPAAEARTKGTAPPPRPSTEPDRGGNPATARTGPRPRYAGPSDFPFADPDTIASGTRYVTYGTSGALGVGDCGVPTWGAKYYVPYLVHGANESTSFGTCTAADSGDAMPAGPGSWADPNTDIWAPSVVYYGGRFILFYAATERGTRTSRYPEGHKCIGKAYASSARGPFADAGEFACPSDGRWALDPDAFVDGGNLYVVYRDDYVTTAPQTGISVVQADSNGTGIWSTRRTLLYSTDLTWEGAGTSTRTIENPSMMKVGNGRWHLFFSGNDWNYRRYSTGIADCGTSPLPASRCNQLWGTTRAYFGYPNTATNPIAGLPLNQLGPGGMSLFRTFEGKARVVWHYIESEGGNPPRRSVIGELQYDAGDWSVS